MNNFSNSNGSLLNADPVRSGGSILMATPNEPGSIKSLKQGLECRFGAGPGSLLNAQISGPEFSGSSLSYLDEVNEDNIEPPGRPDGSGGFATRPSATAALGQDQGSASHRQGEGDKSQSEPGELDEANPDQANPDQANDGEANPGGLAFHGLETTGVDQVQVQLWDNTNARRVQFTAKISVKQGRRMQTYFVSFTESRKWFGKRQDTSPASLPWYEFCRDFIRPAERSYDGDPKYRPRIGHLTAPKRWGDAKTQTPQASATLEWEHGMPVITIFIANICHLFELTRSERRGRKAPGWFAYWQPSAEDQE